MVDGVKTSYLQDLVGGLPQVLVETTNNQNQVYLYGLGRLAQVQNGDAEWFLSDAWW